MAKVHIHSGQGAVGTGDLQLQNGAPMDATLRPVTDAANTASPLELSTGLVAVTSTLQIATNDTEYIDAEDGSGNNRFTVSRASGSQVVNVDYASNPTSATDQVGAIRTYADGASLSDAVSFLRNGYVGIGTNAPDTNLNIVGSNQCNLRVESTVAGGGIDLKDSTTTADNQVGIGAFGDDLCFRSGGAAAGNMRLLANGDLGIGTNSPATSVEIARLNSSLNNNIPTIRLTDLDASSATGQITGRVEFYTSDATPGPAGVTSYIASNTESTAGLGALSFGTGQSGSATERLRISSDGNVTLQTVNAQLRFQNTVGPAPFIANAGTNNQDLYISSGGSERMRITSAGNIGIGTTSPNVAGFPGPTVTVEGPSGSYGAFEIGSLSANSSGDRLGEIRFYNKGTTAPYGLAGIRGLRGTAANDSDLSFWTSLSNSASEKFRATSNGYIRMASGTGGIQFNGDTAAANALNDYEEGTWTPQISNGTLNVAISNTYSIYTKIGNKVTVNTRTINGDVSSFAAGDLISFVGLPYTAGADSYGTMYVRGAVAGELVEPIAIASSSTRITTSLLVSEVITGSTDYWFTFTYFV